MATELGSAFISVGLGTNTLAGDVRKAFGSVDVDGGNAGKSAGGGFLSGFKGIVGVASAVVGAGFFGGLIAEAGRASDATDKFKSTMNFAGIDTSGIEAATAAAKAYADQTVYDLPTIQQTMAQLASNGVDGYTEITEAAGNLNAVAGGNAETFKSVSRTLTQSAGAGRLMTEDWNMLADAIPGASGPLMKALEDAGAYTGNFRKAMEKGEITSEEFQASLLKLGSDPVAVEAARSVTTFEGAIGGLSATVNSGLMSALDAMKPAITGAINLLSGGLGSAFEAIGSLGAKIGPQVAGGFSAMFAAFKAGDGDVTSSGFAGFMERVGGAAREVTGGIRAMFAAFVAGDGEVTSSGFAGFMEQVGGTVRQVFNAIVPVIASLFPMFAALVPQVFALFQALSPTSLIFQALLPVLPQIAAAIGGVLATILPLALSLTSQLLPIITQLVASVLPPLISIFGDVVSSIVPLIAMIAGLLIPIIMALMPVVVTVFSVVADVIKNAMQIVQGIIQVVTGIISGDWDKVWTGIQNIFGGIWNTIVAVVKGALQIIGQVVISGLQLVSSVVGSALGAIGNFFVSAFNSTVTNLGSFIGTVVNFFGGLGGKIMGALGNLGGLLVNAASQIMSGFLSGLQAGFESVKNFVGGIGQWIADNKGPKAYDLALLVPAGGWIMDGLESGIEKSLPSLQRTLGGVSATIAAGVSGGSYANTYTPAIAGAGSSSSGFPSRLTLSVGGREFDAYLHEQVGSGMDQVASIAGGRSR